MYANMNQIRKGEDGEEKEKVGGGEEREEKWGIVPKSKSPFINNQP